MKDRRSRYRTEASPKAAVVKGSRWGFIPVTDRLIFKEVIPPFLFGIAAFTSLFFAGSYLAKLTSLLVEGVSFSVVFKIFLLYFPGVVVLTLPMSVLLAVLLGFSRLSSDSEMVALWAGGVSLWRLMKPVVLLAVAVTLTSYGINEWVAPYTQRQSTELREKALGQSANLQKPFIISDLHEGRYNAIVIVNGGIDQNTKELKDVSVFTGFTKEGPRVSFQARSAKWEGGDDWRLYDGVMQTITPSGTTRNKFEKWMTSPVNINRTPDDIVKDLREPEELTFAELAQKIRRLGQAGQETQSLEVDLYNKLALPFASVVFALIAAPLGLRKQRGGSSVGFGLSVGLIFAYWMVWQYLSAIARSGSVHPVAGAFSANLIFSVVGLALMIRAAR